MPVAGPVVLCTVGFHFTPKSTTRGITRGENPGSRPDTGIRYSNFLPSFSPDGRWLWFLSNRNVVPMAATPWGERNMGPFFDKRTRAYAIALQPGNRFPFQPKDELAPLKPEPSPPAAPVSDETQTAAAAPPNAKPKIPPIAWDGLEQRLYEALLPRVTDREELSDVLAQMSAELSLLHSQVCFGDLRRGDEYIAPATLGALLENAAEGVRIAHVYPGDLELISSLPPLARPEVGAKAGDVIVALDGQPLKNIADEFEYSCRWWRCACGRVRADRA